MPINPNISLAVKGIELQDPLVQYGKVSAIQNAQQQNQLAQMQMQQSQRDLAATNALNQAYKQAYNADTGEVDLNALRSSLATGGYGSKLPGIEKSIFEGREAKTKALKGETDLLDSKLKQSRQFLDTINPNSPDALQRYLQWNEGQFADPVIGKALQSRGITIDQARDQLSGLVSQPGGLQRAILQSAMGIEKFMELNKPTLSNVDLNNKVVSQLVEPLTGKVTKVSEMIKGLAPGEAKRIALEDRRVAVLEKNAIRDADPAFQKRMAAARAMGTEIGKNDVAAAQALPKVLSRAEETVRLIDEMIGVRDSKTGKLIQGSKPHPGFKAAVGMGDIWTLGIPGVAQVTPGTNAAGFKSRFEQSTGQSFLEAFESLKGGGAITEAEGAKATAAINRMSLSTNEDEFIRAALDLQDVVRKGVANAQARAARAEGRNAPAAPATGGGGGATFLGFE
jgi:hypothetical protein